ncbi:MAG: tetratricopeptide repeat protein, partial [Anaerolineales bacterium]|nr:tetratricopeptide repeat protein [Anaerolineales bacterium]
MTSETSSPGRLESQAITAFHEGRLEEAIDGFTAARQAFLAESNQGKEAEMASNLSVALLQAEKPQESLEVIKDIPTIFLNLGDMGRAALAYGNLGSAHEACGDHDLAEVAYRHAIDLFTNLGDTEQHNYTLQALSRLQLRKGKPLEAVT